MTPDKVKEFRKGFGLTVEGFADMLRVDPRTVRRWEAGAQDIPKWLDLYLPLVMMIDQGEPLSKLRGAIGLRRDDDRLFLNHKSTGA